MIKVEKENEGRFLVTVEEESSSSEHAVNLDNDYYRKLTGGKITAEELIKKSFEFLLERESKESILSEFNLSIIKNYFPEYERKIKV
jgi:hypothetical protein